MASSKTFSLMQVFIFSIAFLSSTMLPATVDKIIVPSPGPYTLAFDSSGRGPYTGLTDGRILRYNPSTNAFDFYAVTAPKRPALCNGMITSLLASKCGRPMGLAFNKATNQLYACDASLGLFVVEPDGGQGTLLANSANGTKFRLMDSIDVDQTTGNVYFTDASSTGGINQIPLLLAISDSTGRLLKFDRNTKEVTSLLNGLGGPGGVSISQDGSYLLFKEITGKRVQKYWLKGPKANTAEILLTVTGFIGGMKRISTGDEFWVAITDISVVLIHGIKIDSFGNILERVTFSPMYRSVLLTDIIEYEDSLLLGSLYEPFIGVYRR